MLIVTTEKIHGYEIEKVLGHSFGAVVRSRGLGGNIVAGFRSLAGGEIKEYTEKCLRMPVRQPLIDWFKMHMPWVPMPLS